MAEPEFVGLNDAILLFCRFARANGLSASVKESIGALEAAMTVGVQDRQVLKAALRAVLCSSRQEWERFEELFDAFWGFKQAGLEPAQRKRPNKSALDTQTQQDKAVLMLPTSSDTALSESEQGKAVLGATAHERLKQADFSQIAEGEIADLERIALHLLRQMSMRLSRRLKVSRLHNQVDLRRTIRHSISHGGDPIDLRFRGKKLQQQKLVILLDVSGSMNPYSLFLVRFAYVLQKYFKHVDTFLFSTQLTDITAALRKRQLREALQALSQETAGWSGGTMIGESLREFRTHYGRLLSRDTLFIILSDGWDTGEPKKLAAELSAIKRRTKKVIWLNPLLGLEGYQPLTRGMSVALPHIDVFAPAHNVASLLELERHLQSR